MLQVERLRQQIDALSAQHGAGDASRRRLLEALEACGRILEPLSGDLDHHGAERAPG
ncbi:MAG: hypothetical protein ACYTG1_13565 [Planctomycetota bacterium]